jgi:hypothetical protein
MGILPRAPGGFRFLFIVIDTLTKWMEAMPVVNITQEAGSSSRIASYIGSACPGGF